MKNKQNYLQYFLNNKKYVFFAADFETTYHQEFSNDEIILENRESNETNIEFTKNENSRVFLSGCYCINNDNYFLNYENLATTFNTFASETLRLKHKKAVIFYHNLSYDGSYILNWLQRHNYKQSLKVNKISLLPELNRKEYTALISGGKFFNIEFWWKGVRLIFLDSLKLLPLNLASLGEAIGFKKLKEIVDYKEFKINKEHNYPKEWLIYLKRDCEILKEILKEFYKHEKFSLKKFTLGSLAFNHVKKPVNTNTPNFLIKDYLFFQKWFRGGLCFCNLNLQAKWVYSPNENIKMIDACSMYPSQMIKYLPFGIWEEKPLKEWNNNYCAFYEVLIKKAKIKDLYKDIAVIPKNYSWIDNKKYIRTMFNGELIISPYEYIQEIKEEWLYHFTDIELKMIESLYDIEYKIVNSYYFQTKDYLKENIAKMFQEKKLAKESGDKARTLLAKLKINNIYGKLCQNPFRPQVFYGEQKDIPEDYKILNKKNGELEAYNVVLNKSEDKKAKPIFIGAYITSLSRVSLLDKIKYIIDNGGIFLYCDTDSVAYVDNEKNPIPFNDIGNDLSLWEFEENKLEGGILKGAGFIALCPKQYRIVNKKGTILKFASAGIDKKVMGVVKNQHYNFELSQNKLYKINKKMLKNGKFGKYIDLGSPFSFKKWTKYFKEKIKCPKELKN